MTQANIKKIAAGVVVIFSAAAVWMVLKNGCLFYKFSGFPCPTCGLTRAYKELIAGNITRAFFYHPLFLLPPAAVGAYLFRRKISAKTKKALMMGAVLLLFLVYIVRMLVLFGQAPPMEMNEQAPLIRFFTDLVGRGIL